MEYGTGLVTKYWLPWNNENKESVLCVYVYIEDR